MSERQYIEAAERAIKRAEGKVEAFAGHCHDCHYRRWSSLGRRWDTCSNPIVQLVAFNTADASAKERIARCAEQRDERSVFGDVVCGPNGRLFEQKQSWWPWG